MQTINLSDIKTVNFNMILRCITDEKLVTIADIARITKLSIPTVRKSIEYGVSEKIFEIKEIAESTGGRKATIYAVNNEYFYSIYFAIDNLNLWIVMQNFAGENIYCVSKTINLNRIMSEICYEYEALCQKYANIKLMCIALPCVVDNGAIKEWFYSPANNNTDIKSTLEQKYNIKVLVENDMKASVFAYKKEGDNSNISTVQFGHNGIGIGIMVDGHVLRGNNSFAGEIGYIDDINRNIMSVRYCAKIVRSLICFCNPSEIVFYRSDKQNDFEKIVDVAMKYIPQYVRPKIVISNNYLKDILYGLKILSCEERMIDVSQAKFI